jgi:hypothetical protein
MSLVAIGFLSALLLEFSKLFSCTTEFGPIMTGALILGLGLSAPNALSIWFAAKES